MALIAAAACAMGASWVGIAAAASPGVDPTYGEGGVSRTESQLPAGYKEGSNLGRALAGTNGSVLYVSELVTCTVSYGEGCSFPAMVRRLTPSGSLDGTYGKGGVLNLAPLDPRVHLAEATDGRGRLYVAENDSGSLSLRRFTARGRADTGFGTGGKVTRGGFAGYAVPVGILMAPNGRLVIALAEATEAEYAHHASRVTLLRLLPDGRVDRSFGKKGSAVVGVPSAFGVSVYETPQGATLVVGHNCCGGDDFTPVHRVSSKGKVDVHFDAQERRSQVKALAGLAEPTVAAVVARTDGTIDLFGNSKAAGDPGGPGYVLRLQADGTAESHFGDDGVVTLGPNVVGAEAGSGDSALVSFQTLGPPSESRVHFERLLSDGRPDPRFGGEAGIEAPAPGGGPALVPSADGTALALVVGTKNCQSYCESSPYFVRLIEPSGKSGKGGKLR